MSEDKPANGIADTGGAAPSISIVIASKVGAPFLDKCLDSIENQVNRHGAEVVVVVSGGGSEVERLGAKYPWVRAEPAVDIKQVPALRRRGVEVSTGEIVFVIEEHCSAGDDWLDKGLEAHASGDYAAVGGPIFDDDYPQASDWTTYFIEYNTAIPPFPKGETHLLNDANIAYRRPVLERHMELLGAGYWPMAVHPSIAAEGGKFFMVPDMRVLHLGPWDYTYYLDQRYHFSRAFAGERAKNEPMTKRIAYLLLAPILPFLLLARIGKTVLSKGHLVGRFLKTTPWIFPALVVYVAGEWMGYLAGPGDSLSKVE